MDSKEQGVGTGQLEQFLVLANSSKGRAAAQLIQEALKQPTIFVFGELLDHPNIKALEQSEHKASYELLKLFAFGTYRDYKQNPKNFLDLSPPQLLKLKQLTIVSIAANQKSLPYKQLMTDLDVANVRELEDMIIDCIYAGLIVGKLDQKNAVFEVQNAIGRDIGPNDVQDMIKTLGLWMSAATKVLDTFTEKMTTAVLEEEKKQKEKDDLKAAIKAKEIEIKERLSEEGKGKGGPIDHEDFGDDSMGPMRRGGGGRRQKGPKQ